MDKQQEQLLIEKRMKETFSFLLDYGFSYEYTYEKGGDSSCVYIHRFFKGGARFDLREVSGGDEINLMVFSGDYAFPNLLARYPKETRAFKRKHLFKRATKAERFSFLATLVQKECEKGNLFGIPLK